MLNIITDFYVTDFVGNLTIDVFVRNLTIDVSTENFSVDVDVYGSVIYLNVSFHFFDYDYKQTKHMSDTGQRQNAFTPVT